MKRTRLKRKGTSSSSTAKDRIQALLRRLVIQRDGGCVLRRSAVAGKCGGYKQDGTLVLQAEHLNGRANSISYAELDNIVCLCQYHHIFFKKQQNALYWVLIRKVLGEERWNKVSAWIEDKTPHPMRTNDWLELEKKLQEMVVEDDVVIEQI